MTKSVDAFRTISEVAETLDLPQHVLRFWETRFPQIKPLKRAGGRRFYRPGDVVLLETIRQLLYGEGYTIKGVQRLLRDHGAKAVLSGARPASSALGYGDDTGRGDETGNENEGGLGDHAGLVRQAGFGDQAESVGQPVGTVSGADGEVLDITTAHGVRSAEAHAPLDAPPASSGQSRSRPADREALRAALGLIMDCERILRAARQAAP